MREHYEFHTKGVCARLIQFDLEDGKLHNVAFLGGCPGNLQAIPKLIEGADAGKIARILKGNQCGNRGTSCADQLAIAIEAALGKAS
ncbi:MAG: TIGR03905 family TSCPD domain-containing protein [Synergistaceae bacterium]|nr:TIGR03905 family TSCPD domain-containing protein [Synergistaceae bacterium]